MSSVKRAVRRPVASPNAPGIMPNGTYSPALRIDGGRTLVFVSGQTSRDPCTGELVYPGDIRQQTERTMQNLGALLESAGASFADLAKMTVFIVGMKENFAPMHEVRRKYLVEPFPASSTVEVHALALPGMLIEIEAIAVI
jgi:reactive intermediate/imine deaminase